VVLDLEGILHLFLGCLYLHVVGPNGDRAERHEGQMATHATFLDGAEHRLVSLDVDVDVLEFAEPFAVAIDELRSGPAGDVAKGDHLVPSFLKLASRAAGRIESRGCSRALVTGRSRCSLARPGCRSGCRSRARRSRRYGLQASLEPRRRPG